MYRINIYWILCYLYFVSFLDKRIQGDCSADATWSSWCRASVSFTCKTGSIRFSGMFHPTWFQTFWRGYRMKVCHIWIGILYTGLAVINIHANNWLFLVWNWQRWNDKSCFLCLFFSDMGNQIFVVAVVVHRVYDSVWHV